jgi:hypothetical protein
MPEAEMALVKFDRAIEVGNMHGDVINAFEHGLLRISKDRLFALFFASAPGYVKFFRRKVK